MITDPNRYSEDYSKAPKSLVSSHQVKSSSNSRTRKSVKRKKSQGQTTLSTINQTLSLVQPHSTNNISSGVKTSLQSIYSSQPKVRKLQGNTSQSRSNPRQPSINSENVLVQGLYMPVAQMSSGNSPDRLKNLNFQTINIEKR